MGCCNQKRARWRNPGGPAWSTLPASQTMIPMTNEIPAAQSVAFEYLGRTAMSVMGPITRTQYRFRATGARVSIDHRDVPYISGVPNLQRVRTAVQPSVAVSLFGY
jgi:hypothetical protein